MIREVVTLKKEGLTIEDICAELGISKCQFYRLLNDAKYEGTIIVHHHFTDVTFELVK